MRSTPVRLGFLIAVAALLFGACGAASKAEPVTVRWFCCLGGGDAPEQVTQEKAVADAFNKTHPKIKLTFESVAYAGANDALSVQIASNNGPDIVGPVGIGGANAFHGQWLDLAPLIAKSKYDLSGFPQDAVNIYKLDEGQVGIPFAIYPSALFYKKGMFTEAGLKEPPHKYGDKYTMPDGSQVDWSYATLIEIGKKLTVDKNGKDATQAGFDAANIVQWGYEPQRDDMRGLGAYYGPGSLVAADGKTAQIPAEWKAAWSDYNKAIYAHHITMTNAQHQSPDINPNDYPFFTGKVAMSQNFLWSTYGVADSGTDWDLAALPSYNGKATAVFNADTFRIMKATKHPDEAFEALTYLLGDASKQLLTAYGGFPARTANQAEGVKALQDQFKNTVDWQVAIDGIAHADVPNFEAFIPKYNESLGLIGSGGKYTTRWATEPNLDMDKEVENLRAELQAIWDKK